MKIVLSGNVSGYYRGQCECGFSWRGQGERRPNGTYSPALPVAEAVVHHRMCHNNVWLNLQFDIRFSNWLESYWDWMNVPSELAEATLTR